MKELGGEQEPREAYLVSKGTGCNVGRGVEGGGGG